jgi:hypothetical protein
MGGFGVLLLAGVLVWVLCRRRPPVLDPPVVTARRALERLLSCVEDGAVLSQVSQVLRRYVATAFNLPPAEHTTAEFCRLIERHEGIGPELAARLSGFLRECDERKFAPRTAPAPPSRSVARALQLVEAAHARHALTQLATATGRPQTPAHA